MKAKKELVLATYRDHVKHFGIKLGAKKWQDYKDEHAISNVTYEQRFGKDKEVALKRLEDKKDPIVSTNDLEPIQKAILGGTERVDIRKTKVDISECGYAMIELIRTPAWNKYIKPQIQKDAVDFVMKATMTSGEVRDEAMGGYKYAQKILRTINKWVSDYTYLLREQEKENAKRV